MLRPKNFCSLRKIYDKLSKEHHMSQLVAPGSVGSISTVCPQTYTTAPRSMNVYGTSGTPMATYSPLVLGKIQIRCSHTDMKFPNMDHLIEKTDSTIGIRSRDLLLGCGLVATACAAVAVRSTIEAVITTLGPPPCAYSLSLTEVDLTQIPLGGSKTVMWTGKPIFIRHRTPEEIENMRNVELSVLPHPESDQQRVQVPEWLVMVGICTHLGCVPHVNKGEYSGYFCPCHGSHYDACGRIRKGPAPTNLPIPKYTIDGNTLIVG